MKFNNQSLNQHRGRLWFFSGVSFAAGVAVASWYPNVNGQIFLVAAVLAVTAVCWLWPRLLAAVFLILAALTLGVWRYQAAASVTDRSLSAYFGVDAAIRGVVDEEPELKSNSWRLIVAVKEVNRHPVKGRLVIFRPLSENYAYGDELLMSGQLTSPKVSRDFDGARYWRRFGVTAFADLERVALIDSGKGQAARQWLIGWRQTFVKQLARGLPYPESALGSAMVLGQSNDLSQDLRAAFSRSGLTHIIAISGLNVSLLVGLLLTGGLFVGLKRQYAILFSLAGVIVYVCLVGAPASAVRAGIMGALILTAVWLGRQAKLINALALAAAATLAVNPFLLRDDLGWQLSFLAVLGIIYLYPWLRLSLASSWPNLDLVAAGLALTLSAQLTTWPLVAVTFQQVSLVAPLANVLAVWTAPAILVSVFVGLALNAWWSWLWWWPARWLLGYLISVAYVTASWNGAVLATPSLAWWWLVAYYLFLILAAVMMYWLAKNKKIQALSSDKEKILW